MRPNRIKFQYTTELNFSIKTRKNSKILGRFYYKNYKKTDTINQSFSMLTVSPTESMSSP